MPPRPERRPARLVAAVAAVAVVAALAAACGSGSTKGSSAATAGKAETPSTTNIAGVQTFTVAGHNHVQGTVDYPQTPPVAGDHAPIWQNCGFYSQPIVKEQGVHSMEHGAVWITYSPDLPADQVAVLHNLARSQTYVLVSPYPGLPSPIVASAWGVQLQVPSISDPRLPQFVAQYRQGPQTREPGAACSGAAGSPE